MSYSRAHRPTDDDDRVTPARGHPPSGRWTAPELSVVAVTVALMFLLTFPVYTVANQARPIILGMPLSMFWMVAWIAVEFLVLLAIYGWDRGRGRR